MSIARLSTKQAQPALLDFIRTILTKQYARPHLPERLHLQHRTLAIAQLVNIHLVMAMLAKLARLVLNAQLKTGLHLLAVQVNLAMLVRLHALIARPVKGAQTAKMPSTAPLANSRSQGGPCASPAQQEWSAQEAVQHLLIAKITFTSGPPGVQLPAMYALQMASTT